MNKMSEPSRWQLLRKVISDCLDYSNTEK